MHRILVSLLVTVAIVGLVPGGTPAESPAAAGSDAQRVQIAGASFGSVFVLPVVQVSAGDAVVWENLDPAFGHSALAWDGSWTTGVLAPGAVSAPVTFPTPGEYVYACGIHSQTMLGVVQVS